MSTSPVPEHLTNEPHVRLNIRDMSDREMLEEILTAMRAIEDALSALQDSPMVSAIMSGQNPLTAMMGR